MKKLGLMLISVLMIGCSPKVDNVSYQDAFKEWNIAKKTNEVDSSASMAIYFNTYEGLFEGRESFLRFKKNQYHINFKTIDTLYTEKDIERFSVFGYYEKDTAFIPKYCKVKVKHISKEKIIVEFEIKDDAITDNLKGKFKLKLDTELPEHYDVFKYYKN